MRQNITLYAHVFPNHTIYDDLKKQNGQKFTKNMFSSVTKAISRCEMQPLPFTLEKVKIRTLRL